MRRSVNRRWLLYGAYGYTGRLIARLAAERGLSPLLAGRNPRKLEAMASSLGLEQRAFRLGKPAAIVEALHGVDVVVNAAGPFSRTFRRLVDACLARPCHYLDITGEIEVFEEAWALDERARAAGVILLPGVGFDVVPTDCAASRAASRLHEPTHLDIAFVASGSPSAGTLKTMLEGFGQPGKIRRDGRIVDVALGSVRRRVPFNDRERDAMAIPWGDVSTAWHSTGVPNVRVFLASRNKLPRWSSVLRPLLRMPPARRLMQWVVGRMVDGPGAEQLARGWARVWCEARNATGEVAEVELLTPNGYALTADSAVTAVESVLAPSYEGPPSGALTPSRAFGDDFVSRLRGVEWVKG